VKANKYTDQLEDADKNIRYLKQRVMKLEQEIGKGDYEESCQGKRARYNAPTEETSTNMSNNKQVPAVRAPQNYSQVLQAPAPTHVQMDIDKEESGMGQFEVFTVPHLFRSESNRTPRIPRTVLGFRSEFPRNFFW